MNVEDLKELMEKSKANRFCYSINGPLKDDAYHIVCKDGIWEVFYMERGLKSTFGTFDSEEEACQCFHEIVRKHLRI
jgi:hypothetical protein